MSTTKKENIVLNSSVRALGSTKKRSVSLNQSRKGIFNAAVSGVSRTSNSGSRRSVDYGRSFTYKPPVRVLDNYGQDITPLPLLKEDKRINDGTKDTPTDLLSQASVQQTGLSQAGGSSYPGVGIAMGFTRSRSQMSSSMTRTDDSHSEMGSEDMGDHGNVHSLWTEMKSRPNPIEILTEKDLERIVEIQLKETDTFAMFEQEPICVANDSEEVAEVRFRNERYKNLLIDKVGNDKYSSRGMGTYDEPSISKPIQTEKINLKESGMTVTTWDIYDSWAEQVEVERRAQMEGAETSDAVDSDVLKVDANPDNGGMNLDEQATPEAKSKRKNPLGSDRVREGTVTSIAESDMLGTVQEGGSLISGSVDAQNRIDQLLKSESMANTLFIMERAVVLNNYQSMLAKYRGLEVLEDELTNNDRKKSNALAVRPQSRSNLVPTLQFLWKYSCQLTKGRNVTGLAWNRQNKDILAVAYGQHEYGAQRGGLVCCWSAKNIQYPERVLQLPSGVTAVDWSQSHPSLLAVGMHDGVIFVFDVRQRSQDPIIDTSNLPGRHLGPVRCLEWVMKEGGHANEMVEILVSISSDGRVTQWSLRKGFEHSNLMKLKRVNLKVPGATIKSKEKKVDALISSFAFGTAISFNPSDQNIYLAGTEDGLVHKCSCSYNEQFLESYNGHTAPIYGISWSPFANDVFLTCAGDWTIKLWHMEHQNAVMNFQSAAKSVNDVCWSPNSSIVFAVVNDGALEVWNLSLSKLDPVITEFNVDPNTKSTAVRFSLNSDSLVVGDSDGNVQVYKLENMMEQPKNQLGDHKSQNEALDRIIQEALRSHLTT